ncbi:MAG TPA: SDR family oxidoreductase [Acidimicrobiia bacterium]|nr:SDR family oxidoreductase [Acidimicrobiia bacterium]
MKVLVIGASAGIGRAVAEAAVRSGHEVAVAARRREVLDEIAGAVPFQCDVRRPDTCGTTVEEAAAALGGLDGLVIAAGASPLSRLADAGVDHWRTVVETNLVGAALLTRAAIPHLEARSGVAVYMTVTSPGRPWPWLVPYFASKAAMDEMVRGWRAEHPSVGFTSVSVGPTASEFAAGWDGEAAGKAFAAWDAGGYLATHDVMTPEQVADEILGVLASPVRIDELKLMPRRT